MPKLTYNLKIYDKKVLDYIWDKTFKASEKLYPFAISFIDVVSQTKEQPENYRHRIILHLNKNQGQKHQITIYSIEDIIPYEEVDTSLSSLIAKEFFSLLYPRFKVYNDPYEKMHGKPAYKVSLNKDLILIKLD